MIKLSTVLRRISIDVRAHAIAQVPDLTHFLKLAEIFRNEAAEVETDENSTEVPGLNQNPDVLTLPGGPVLRVEKLADVGVQDQTRQRLLARMAGNIAAGMIANEHPGMYQVGEVARHSVTMAKAILAEIESRG